MYITPIFRSQYPKNLYSQNVEFKAISDLPTEKDLLNEARKGKLDVNQVSREDGETLFQKLVANNYTALVSYSTAKPSTREHIVNFTNNGISPLDYAKTDEMRSLLLSRGAKKIERQNVQNSTQPKETNTADARETAAKIYVENPIKVAPSQMRTVEEMQPEEALKQVETPKQVEETKPIETSVPIEAPQLPQIQEEQKVDFFDSFDEVEDEVPSTEIAQQAKPEKAEDKPVKKPEYKEYTHYEVNPEMKSLEDIIGMENIKQELRENIIIPIKDSTKNKLCEIDNLSLPNGILFASPNGTDSIVSALVNETDLPALQIHSMQELAPMIADIEKNYKENGIRTIVVASNFDNMYTEDNNSVQIERNKFVNTLKNCSKKGMLFVATTKDKASIGDTFIHAGLIDKVLTLPCSNANDRQEFIHQKINDKKILAQLNGNLEEITDSTEGIPFSEIEKILNETARTAISRGETENIMPIFKEQLAEYTTEKGLTPIDDFNRTSAYDTSEFKRTPMTADDPTIDDLGGMPEIKKRLNELYIEPMERLDDLYKELGNDALPDGAIFYGEPGNGKTYTAKALAKTLGLPFYETKLSDIGTALVHEEGKAFKKLADQLNRKFQETGERSVWFLDEFESLGGERGGSAQHNKELTDALLQELNNPAQRGFILIAATNDLDGVDSALKRRGRLGNWIHFSNPTFEERYDVIKKSLEKSPSTRELAKDDNYLREIAKDFDGMSMASITSVVKDAKRLVILKGTDFRDAIEDCKAINNERMMGEFCNKSGLKQHQYNEWDFQSLDELGGMQKVKEQLQESVIDVWDPEIRTALLANKRRLPGGVILYGPPGTGKTTIVETLARQMEVPLYKMDYSSINDSQYIHQISKHVVEIFDRLELQAKILKKPVMLFFDEAERFFPNFAEKHQIEEVNTYKDKMNNASMNGIILVGATNYIDKVNPEITGNPRRMGTKIEVDNPDESDRSNLFQKSLLSLPILAGVLTVANCQELAKATEGWSIGQIADTIDKVITQAIKKKENIKFETMLSAFKKRVI